MRTLVLPPRGFSVPRRVSRLLFAWEARDGSLTARTGQSGTFSRASIGTAIDSNGVLRQLVHSQPRWTCVDTDGDAIREPFLLLEEARTNLCLQSENFGTTWTTGGTPTRVAAADTECGVSLDLIGDDSAGAQEWYAQAIAFTGNAVKAVSIVMKEGTSSAAGGSFVQIFDATAGLARLGATVTWVAGVPSVVMGTGTFLGYEKLINGKYRLLFQTTSVIAANTHEVDVYPAVTLAQTGNVYAGGVQVENALFPSSYIKTTTATVTRGTDTLTFPFNALPQALTVYAKLVERGTTMTGAATGLLGVGNSTNPAFFLLNDSAGHYAALHRRAGDASTAVAASPSMNQLVELRAILNPDGSVQLGQSLGSAAESLSGLTAALALASAWNDTTLTINSRGAGTEGFVAINSVRIAAGVRSLDYMRKAV